MDQKNEIEALKNSLNHSGIGIEYRVDKKLRDINSQSRRVEVLPNFVFPGKDGVRREVDCICIDFDEFASPTCFIIETKSTSFDWIFIEGPYEKIRSRKQSRAIFSWSNKDLGMVVSNLHEDTAMKSRWCLLAKNNPSGNWETRKQKKGGQGEKTGKTYLQGSSRDIFRDAIHQVIGNTEDIVTSMNDCLSGIINKYQINALKVIPLLITDSKLWKVSLNDEDFSSEGEIYKVNPEEVKVVDFEMDIPSHDNRFQVPASFGHLRTWTKSVVVANINDLHEAIRAGGTGSY